MRFFLRFFSFLMCFWMILPESWGGFPQFVSLRTDKVNLRTGPGKQHPIDWVLTRQSLPVEVMTEYSHWCKIRTHEGITGWVHQRMIKVKPTALILKKDILYKNQDENSPKLAYLHPLVVADLSQCDAQWCKVKVQGYKGWIRRASLWGVPKEKESGK